jgi:hypothetical protein
MIFPRITAIVCVLLLTGSLSLVCIGGLTFAETAHIQGNNVEHTAGTIVAIGPGLNFVLETPTGQHLRFQCGNQCHASLGHLQRHLHEHAHTDVYYVHGRGNSLLAIDVD